VDFFHHSRKVLTYGDANPNAFTGHALRPIPFYPVKFITQVCVNTAP
jgi:hypothetical protein